jgi:hypothetical protein
MMEFLRSIPRQSGRCVAYSMPVLVLAANIGFVNFDNAAKLLLRLYHRRADL